MITSLQLYWLTRLDYFYGIKCGFLFIGSVLSLVSLFGFLINREELYRDVDRKYSSPLEIEKRTIYYGRWYKTFRISLCFSVFLLIIGFFGNLVPTTKEMAAIIVLPKIINNQKVQQLPDKVLDLANEWLEELGPNKEKESK